MQTWVVVASAARARIFALAGKGEPWREMFDMVNPEERQQRQSLVSDKPGRMTANAGGQRHAMEPTNDSMERVADGFARALLGRLEEALEKGQFTRLILFAPPHFLGMLRGRMDRQLNAVLVGEVNKDLTREDPATLQAHVAKLT